MEGTSTYTGPTIVNQGTLYISGQDHYSPITVQSGAILSGGTYTTSRMLSVNVQSGGTLEASMPNGTAQRAMTFGAGTLSNGAEILSRVYTNATAGLDTVGGTGTIVFAGTTTVDFDLTSATSISSTAARNLLHLCYGLGNPGHYAGGGYLLLLQ